jgi:NADPH2:quinone reductase
MLAIRVHEWAGEPRVETIPDAVRGDGETLVRVTAAALAHLDLTVASGTFDLRPELPYVGGVEGSGEVIASDVHAPGTQVLLRGGGLGLLRDGTWREYASVPDKAITLLPVPLPPEVAATFFVPCTTAYVALHDIGTVAPGEKVAVVGATGAVGAMALQLARNHGAEVVGVVGRAGQLANLPAGVAGVALDDEAGVAAAVEGRPFDLLVDTVGGEDLIGRTRWVRQGGRAVCIGYTAGVASSVHLPSWLLDDVALLPVNMIRRERRAREVAPELARMIAEGTLSVPVETVSADQAPSALLRLASGNVRGRAAVVF